MTDTSTTTASVALQRAARYGKQLANHMGHRFGGGWSPDTESARFDIGTGTVEIGVVVGDLRIRIDSVPQAFEQLEEAIGRHLVQFVNDPNFSVTWTRTDGTAGTTQNAETVEVTRAERARRAAEAEAGPRFTQP